MKQLIFISYDLGLHGDYVNLYKWLDTHDAKECGDSFCCLTYEFKTVSQVSSDEETRNMLKEIHDDIKASDNLSGRDRFYIVSELYYKGQKKMMGTFIFGKRLQKNPWDGASNKEIYSQDIDE
ncbi:MAG: hypothetical protein IKP54_08330 [Bacteroidales bacterium]|nr:hypothetical protein [Bacteroidales bacterium]